MNNSMDVSEPLGKEIGVSMNIGDWLQVAKKKWRWFFCSVIVCLLFAIYYLISTANIYERKATVLIRDDKNMASAGEMALYQELTGGKMVNNTSNELLIFKSSTLMAETVRRLNLDVNYSELSGLMNLDLYKKTPVMVYFIDEDVQHTFLLKLKLLNNSRVQLSGSVKGEKKKVIVYLNDTVETPFGKLVVVPTSAYGNGKEWEGKSMTINKVNFESVVRHYSQALNVTLADEQSTVIDLSLRDASATRAEDILNTLISVYNEDAINDKNQISINTENFINDRLEVIQQELGGVDQQIEEYKRENRLTDIQSNAQIYLEENRDYSRSGVNIRNQYSMAIYIKRYLVDPSKTNQLIPANTGIQDVGIESQIEAYNTRLLKRNRLVESGSDKNPVVQDLTTALNAERQNIIRAVDNLIVNLNIQLNNAKSKEQVALENIASVPQQQKEVVSISRQQKIKEELYLFLLNKREENAINKAITQNQLRIIDAATGSNLPVSPSRNMTLLAAILIGLLIPIFLIYATTLLNVYVRGRQDLIHRLSIPYMGEIPLGEEKLPFYKKFIRKFVKHGNRKNDRKIIVAVKENSQDTISEAFRVICANLDFMNDKTHAKVLMCTSYNAGGGKTFVSVNLAENLILSGKKVLLIDADTRNASLTKGLGQPFENVGITNYLTGQISNVDELINHGMIQGNIDLILSGPISSNPTELLKSSRFEELINELRSRYDYIILDTASIGTVADTVVANRVVDMTLFIVRAGLTYKRLLPDIEQLYREGRLKNMALILNGITPNFSCGYDGYGYK